MPFVVMHNALGTSHVIHERYDLKGSTVGRSATADEKLNPEVILKDLDIHRKLSIGPEMKSKLFQQLEKDTKVNK